MGVATNRRMSTPGSDEGQAPQRESANARFAGRSDSPVSAGRDAWSSSFAQASPALPIGSATPPGSTSASSGWGLPPPFRRTGFGSRAWVPRGPAFRAKRKSAPLRSMLVADTKRVSRTVRPVAPRGPGCWITPKQPRQRGCRCARRAAVWLRLPRGRRRSSEDWGRRGRRFRVLRSSRMWIN
jgi:hypothetical protein